MYETEVNRKTECAAQIPKEILARFDELRGKIVARSLIPWGEHCTECVWPTCFSTCDLYTPREDKKCRRFVDGMVRVDHVDGLSPYLLKLRFKRWAKLWAMGNAFLHSMEEAKRLEMKDRKVGRIIQFIPLTDLRCRISQKHYVKKRDWSEGLANRFRDSPTCFLLEIHNPQSFPISVSLTMRNAGKEGPIPFQSLLHLPPGFTRARISFSEICKTINTKLPFEIEMIPNHEAEDTTLYFGFMDFVLETSSEIPPLKLCKCVVWDLDNTLWTGTLMEDGPEKLELRPGIKDVIQELDRRGILMSIASKNDPEQAMAVLKKFGLEEYFLVPQISWNPKGETVKHIAKMLNIGLDSLIFIDDSEFERANVKATCPEVTVVDARTYRSLTERQDCQTPVTVESKKRRHMYREQELRETAMAKSQGDYFGFLRECEIRLHIRSMTVDTLSRVHELTQRTNQMNFSGNRYERKRLVEILETNYLDAYVLECEDRFGSYGTIGFGVVDKRECHLKDLMFSCRVQGKRVEHAFLTYVLKAYRRRTGSDFYVSYRKTPRNSQAGKVFDDFGFETLGNENGTSVLVFRRHREVPDDALIEIIDECFLIPDTPKCQST